MALGKGVHDGVAGAFFGVDHRPSPKGVEAGVMGVVGGDEVEVMPHREPDFSVGIGMGAILLDFATGVEDFHAGAFLDAVDFIGAESAPDRVGEKGESSSSAHRKGSFFQGGAFVDIRLAGDADTQQMQRTARFRRGQAQFGAADDQ